MDQEHNARYFSMLVLLFVTYVRACDTEHKVDSLDLKLDQCIATSQSGK